MSNGDATFSLKGYTHQLYESIIYLLDNNIKEIKIEGIEDIDYLTDNNNKYIIQLKYHTLNTTTRESIDTNSGLFKVYKRYMLNNCNYNNTKKIIYYIYDENNKTSMTQNFKKKLNINIFKKTVLSYNKKKKENIININNNFIKYTKQFIKLLEIKIINNYNFNYNIYYTKIKESNIFNLSLNNISDNMTYNLFHFIFKFITENLFNGNKIIYKNEFINYINENIIKTFNLNDMINDLINMELNNNYTNEHMILLFNNTEDIIKKINDKSLFKLIQLLNNNQLRNKYMIIFTQKIIKEIDTTSDDFNNIYNSILLHCKYIITKKCKYTHFTNLLNNKKFNIK
jgi:hypothetical protein